ncbi:MAG: SPFH domain-containing protein [Acidobacteriota bacterium]|nr:SPFH domain-containing protein [Acidobacteriota bacterium]
MIRERVRVVFSGWLMLPVVLAANAVTIYLIVRMATSGDPNPLAIVALSVLELVCFALFFGFFIVNPNEAQVLQLFGAYAGTVKSSGFGWANPLFTKRRISQRVRNFESQKLKVNDNEGNPIEIAAVVVWRVIETAEACFEVDDYEHYVKVQSEAALRNMTTHYPYDAHQDDVMSLRGNTADVAQQLKVEVQDRLSRAGVEVIEARISHLAYAQEIAAAMLQRQQAGAIIAARQRIVEGAVGMVEMALEMLSRRDIVELDNERKAAMVSNLLVVLCGERGTQPIINTGSIYQ